MKTFLVGYKPWHDMDIQLHIIVADDWKKAMRPVIIDHNKNSCQTLTIEQIEERTEELLTSLPDDLDAAKSEAYNQNWEFNVKELESK